MAPLRPCDESGRTRRSTLARASAADTDTGEGLQRRADRGEVIRVMARATHLALDGDSVVSADRSSAASQA